MAKQKNPPPRGPKLPRSITIRVDEETKAGFDELLERYDLVEDARQYLRARVAELRERGSSVPFYDIDSDG